jgi:hypothetical protein
MSFQYDIVTIKIIGFTISRQIQKKINVYVKCLLILSFQQLILMLG